MHCFASISIHHLSNSIDVWVWCVVWVAQNSIDDVTLWRYSEQKIKTLHIWRSLRYAANNHANTSFTRFLYRFPIFAVEGHAHFLDQIGWWRQSASCACLLRFMIFDFYLIPNYNSKPLSSLSFAGGWKLWQSSVQWPNAPGLALIGRTTPARHRISLNLISYTVYVVLVPHSQIPVEWNKKVWNDKYEILKTV